MAETTITAKALRSFASYVMGHGIVSGDPDAEDGKLVKVPESQVEAFIKAGYIADPADDETLADDEAALAEMTGAPVDGEQSEPVVGDAPAAEDAAPVAPAKPKK